MLVRHLFLLSSKSIVQSDDINDVDIFSSKSKTNDEMYFGFVLPGHTQVQVGFKD